MKLEELIVHMCSKTPTRHEMDVLDDHIKHALDVARKHVEGIKRNVPFTTIKTIKESTMKFIKAMTKRLKERR